MSLRLEMLQVARLAPRALGQASDLVQRFLLDRQHQDGGFCDRMGRSDLYYTVFAVEGLLALEGSGAAVESQRWQRLTEFLLRHGAGEKLDFVHLCCLARCRADAALCGVDEPETSWVYEVEEHLRRHRTKDGGFHVDAGAERGTAYGAFLGLGAYQDLGLPLPETEALLDSLQGLRTSDGAWANEAKVPSGSTNATAAVLTIWNNQHRCLPVEARDWLIRQQHQQGGFKAMPAAPMPDLLSTATALHALSGFDWPLDQYREVHLDFVDTLWTNEGSFHGNWSDEHIDTEYAFYALLALGHLSV